jgi:hypothetical protein
MRLNFEKIELNIIYFWKKYNIILYVIQTKHAKTWRYHLDTQLLTTFVFIFTFFLFIFKKNNK